MAMKEIIKWLQGMEKRAEDLYREAGEVLKEDDPELSSLVEHLAAEEADHFQCMQEVNELFNALQAPESITELDKETTRKIEAYFHCCEQSLKAGDLTVDIMVEMIVDTEFSEWNDIFLYTVKLVKGFSRKDSIRSIIDMQRHKDRIKEFIESRAEYGKFLERIKAIPDIWNESILIVDDEEVILEVLENVLVEDKLIERAINGEEALKKLGEKYFSAIITDVHMPVMNGIEFYKRAVEMFPNVGERFIFFTAFGDSEFLKFIKDNDLRMIDKPSPIGEIKRIVREVIDKASA